MSGLRRGFKTWCENAAKGYRRDLGIPPTAALDPRRLAEYLKIVVWTPAQVPGLSHEDLRQLTVMAPDEWSAATLREGEHCLVILNDAHDVSRQNNTLAHEIGHIVLKHEPAKMFVTFDGLMMMSDYNEENEQEAICFAGAILVPREALVNLISSGATNSDAANYFNVSDALIRMRRNTTGIDIQAARRRGVWIP
ncbi:ImmA/IrrE family metallo-endopeptidase [Roseiarcus fermentans]|uniref:ImmA/IrrE family metallo-endopeptidase n=1 Tax=Roseiarcus fermentans TaxID=1473586 RepID=UPI000DEB9CD2|nr:ImmA/IrrE family metallo-endopeptidase [Roseiarcus fermentans]